ncbi:MAG: GNAT family N-acetyltransferase [Eubacteriales bacterium]|nr:GNAT family N-acetyltransferase [Eubacteriales bacterium]
MNEFRFIQVQQDNSQHYEVFKNLMFPYNRELDENKLGSEPTSDEFILKFTQSCINMQGTHDRHLELAFVDNEPIGFLYGKVDHEHHRGHKKIGYGYVMEFYIKPEHRRKGYGRIMLRRLEQHFSGHGIKRMYLNTGASGEAFWKAMGFKPTDEIQPHNNMLIWEKDIRGNDVINISISEYLTHELVEKIAFMQWRGTTPKDFNQIRLFSIYNDKYDNDCFNVIAFNENDDVIGRLYCVKNQENPKRWYYGDLAVIPSYRRMKIATRMIKAAIQRISDIGGETLCCYTEPENTASINLQKSLGFIEKPTLPFNLLINDGRVMFEISLGEQFNVIPATVDEARFIMMFYAQNRDALHGKNISLNEWKEVLSRDDPDEQNFLVCKGAMPVAWLRINGLDNKDMAWISMLAVSDKFQRQGVGSFAVRFAEDFVRSGGIKMLGIHTTVDNIAAQNCYKKLGYHIHEESEGTTGDGVKRMGYTFVKNINR